MSIKEKLLASAQKNLQKGQVAKAIKDYQQIVELDPRDIRNRQKLAELFCRAGMNAEALGEYGAVAAYYGDNGFYLKAIAVYKQMQKLDPEQVNIYNRLAELNVKQGLVGNAQAEYRNLLAMFERKKLLTDAIAVLQKMAELEPDNFNIQIKIAECYAQSGLREKAREEFSQILAKLLEAQDIPRMVRLYELFMPIFPGDAEIRGGYARALVSKGDTDQGLRILKDLLKVNPDDRHLLNALALAYRTNEDFENERLTYQHLLKQTPGDLEVRESFIRACLAGGEYSRALTELEEWKEAFLGAGQAVVLRLFYEDLREYCPGDARIQQGLALIAVQTGVGDTRSAAIGTDCTAFAEAGQEEASFLSDSEDELLTQLPEKISAAAANESADTEESATEAEEIPLEFLESAVDSLTFSPSEKINEQLVASAVVEETPVSVAEEPFEEMEFELEFSLDDPLLDTGLGLESSTTPAVDEAAIEAEAYFPSNDPVDDLEELEELVEFDAIEEIEELTGVDSPDNIAAVMPGAGQPADKHSGEAFDGGLTNLELGELLSDLESVTEPPNLRDELDEAEFYLQQGLLDDAERVCRQILEFDTSCSAAREKLNEAASRRRAATGSGLDWKSMPSPADVAPVKKTTDLPLSDGLVTQTRGDGLGQDDGFDAFRIGAETPIDIEDTETHFNLGIAYKEMGLFDEAVAEFDKALKNPGRMVDSLVLKGSCLFIKGDFAQAEKVFKCGLTYSGLNADERLSLNYEMGLLYETWGRPLEALDSFQLVADVDLFFRDVGDKIEELRKTLGLDVNAGKDDPGAGGSRGRVSYI